MIFAIKRARECLDPCNHFILTRIPGTANQESINMGIHFSNKLIGITSLSSVFLVTRPKKKTQNERNGLRKYILRCCYPGGTTSENADSLFFPPKEYKSNLAKIVKAIRTSSLKRFDEPVPAMYSVNICYE